MKQKTLKHIIKARLQKIHQACKKISRHNDENHIHAFRVEIKKLRALLRLAALELKDPDKLKLPRKLKKAYDIVGEIRDTRLQMERINAQLEKDAMMPDMYFYLLGKKIGKKKKQFNQLLTKRFFPVVKHKLLQHLPAAIGTGTPLTFMQQKANAVKTLMSEKTHSDEDLHTIRKNLKDIMYDMHAAESDIRAVFPDTFMNNDHINTIKQLSEQLGNFNDICVAAGAIEADRIAALKETERKQLNDIRHRWLEQKAALKQETLMSLTGFYPVIASIITASP